MKAIKIHTGTEQDVYIEISEEVTPVVAQPGAGTVAGGGKTVETIDKLRDVGTAIADVCRTLQDRIQKALGDSKPAELTLEFGVKLAGETGIPLVTKGSVEGTFQVTATWNFK